MEGSFFFKKISGIGDADAIAFFKIFEASFPFEERRAREDWRNALADLLCDARLYAFSEEPAAAILVAWNFSHCRYVEYFAIAPNVRGGGIGSKLLKNFIEESNVPVVLEILPPEENAANARRLWFYERLGFFRNDGSHFHPPYHAGFSRDRLEILNSGNAPLSAEAREKFIFDLENRAMRYAPKFSAGK